MRDSILRSRSMRARVAASTSWGRSNKRNRVTYHQSRAEGETRGHTGEQRGKAAVGPNRAHPSEGSQIVLCFFFQLNLLLQPGRTDRQNRQLVGSDKTGPGDDWLEAAQGMGSGQGKKGWPLGRDRRPRPPGEGTENGPISVLQPHPGSLCPYQIVTSLGLEQCLFFYPLLRSWFPAPAWPM